MGELESAQRPKVSTTYSSPFLAAFIATWTEKLLLGSLFEDQLKQRVMKLKGLRKATNHVESEPSDAVAGDSHGFIPLLLTGNWYYSLEASTTVSCFQIESTQLFPLLIENEELENAEVIIQQEPQIHMS